MPVTFVWIGTNGNLPQLEIAVPALESLSHEIDLRLLVISGRGLDVTARFPVENRRWSLETQIGDLLCSRFRHRDHIRYPPSRDLFWYDAYFDLIDRITGCPPRA